MAVNLEQELKQAKLEVKLLDEERVRLCNEIARLRGDIQVLKLQRDANLCSECPRSPPYERYRAALERIADYFPDYCHKFQTTEAVNMKEIARETLKDG